LSPSQPITNHYQNMIQKIVGRIPLRSRWKLAVRTVPVVAVILLLKLAMHYLGYEFLSPSSLFTAVVSASIFLIGFLLSGVLGDYKESEKIPGDLGASLETMADEGFILYKNKKSKEARDYLVQLSHFNRSLIAWFYGSERTESLMEKLSAFNECFLAFESQTQANYISRLKQEQNLIRKMINRIHTIRETSFLGTGYAIAEIISAILVMAMIFIKIEPFYESMFFVSFVSFILIYMIHFIKDVDNPFAYGQRDSEVEEVSLRPVLDSCKRIDAHLKEIEE